jgi:hypothetical protein
VLGWALLWESVCLMVMAMAMGLVFPLGLV